MTVATCRDPYAKVLRFLSPDANSPMSEDRMEQLVAAGVIPMTSRTIHSDMN